MLYKTHLIRHMLITLCILLIIGPASAQTNAQRCRIKSMIGDVKVQRGKSPKWVKARPNMMLKQSDAIRTFVESEVELIIGDGSVLSLKENTTLELSSLKKDQGAKQTGVKILTGDLLANVKKMTHKKSKFEFETPTAVAAIRGTKVGFTVNKDQTSIKVYEGKVAVTPKGSKKSKELKSNQQTTVKKGQKDIVVEEMRETATDEKASEKDSVAADSTVVTDTTTADSTATEVKDTTAEVEADTTSEGKEDTTAVADTVKAAKLILQVMTPENGISIPAGGQVPVSGKVMPPQASVKVRGNAVKVLPSGEFRLMLKAPVDPGEYTVKIEASFMDQSKSVSRKFVVKDIPLKLTLSVFEPADKQVTNRLMVKVAGMTAPGAEVTANGVTIPVGNNGGFAKEIPLPKDADGEVTIDIEATLKGETKTITRTVIYDPDIELILNVFEPQNNQIITKPMIRVAGLTTPGAEVIVSGMTVPVSSNGNFMKEIPIPDEEGKIDVEIEAAYKGKTVNVVRTVEYKAPEMDVVIIIQQPADGQIICDNRLPVKGNVQPSSITEIAVNGVNIPVRSGTFNGIILLPAEQGEHDIEFEASTEKKNKIMRRTVRYEPSSKTCNNLPPTVQPSTLPVSSKVNTLLFTVYDKTPLDEITFYSVVDGSKDSESGIPGGRFQVELEPGIHEYEIYAEDIAGNRSNTVKGRVSYLGSTDPVIRLENPTSPYKLLHIPPNVPEDDFTPEFTIEFMIDNLPDDNPKLLREVRVRNMLNGDSKNETNFTGDNEFDFDIELARGKNTIRIEVKDISDRVVVKDVVIEVK